MALHRLRQARECGFLNKSREMNAQTHKKKKKIEEISSY